MSALLGSDAECQQLDEALQRLAHKPARALRLNPLRLKEIGRSASEGPTFLRGLGIEVGEALPWEALGLRLLESGLTARDLALHPACGAGLYYLQEPGAMEAVAMLEPKPGERILDLCAAPGGKASQIAERLGGRGWLVANEPVRPRAERLDALLARQGPLNVSVFALDPTAMAERFAQHFDAVMVDAPCSGESLFAKRKEDRSDVRNVDVAGCARRQFVIFDRAAACVRAGGRLVYSTCTYSREENENIVESFLRDHPDWSLERQQRRWPHRDGVAGGFAALLRAPAQLEPAGAPDFDEKNTAGLLRKGAQRWNGEEDLYARAMGATDASGLTDFEVDEAGARKFLAGEALVPAQAVPRGHLRVVWRGLPLGAAKSVGERLNNLLPKVLRSQGAARGAAED